MDESANSAAFETERENAAPGPVILLGLGFTTARLARRLLLRRVPVWGVARRIARFAGLASVGLQVAEYAEGSLGLLPKGSVIVHTIPPLGRDENQQDENEKLRWFISSLAPRRVIYISSTSVYGKQTQVDSGSFPAPCEEKGIRRLEEEAWLTSQGWSCLVIRPAAIYGPGRGIHVRLQDGRGPRSEGTAVVSRVHVDDLAAILECAILMPGAGAWPVADKMPCSTDTIRDWCAELLEVEPTPSAESGIDEVGKQLAGRTVRADGTWRELELTQALAGFPEGLLASLGEK